MCNHRTVRQAIVVHDVHVVVLTIRQFVLVPKQVYQNSLTVSCRLQPTSSCNSLARMAIFPSLRETMDPANFHSGFWLIGVKYSPRTRATMHAFSWFMRTAHAPRAPHFIRALLRLLERERPIELPSPEGLSRVRLLPPPPWKGPKIDCIFTWRNRQNYRGYFTSIFCFCKARLKREGGKQRGPRKASENAQKGHRKDLEWVQRGPECPMPKRPLTAYPPWRLQKFNFTKGKSPKLRLKCDSQIF